MKIAALPQVEFDSFPTDASTKVCIFTKLPYPIPDLSHVIKDGRKLKLYCIESTVLTIARFAKRLPIELFGLLPIGTNWLLFNSTIVDGLTTPFKVACLPTGSVSDSVMLMISLLNDRKNMILYTGTFQKCSEVLVSDFFIKYSKSFNDIYIDNTFANSKHLDVIQDARACYDIMQIVKDYPKHKIHLQMEMFESMDLLVELARRHHINVKLNILQQLFFYKSQYKHLFQYDAQISSATDLNKTFLFKNQPEVVIVPYEAADMEAYKMCFDKKKIITIRLIASEREIRVKPETIKKGLLYITHVGHAGAITLHTLIHATNPKRIHPIIDDGPDENTMSRIPADILNDDCEIVYDSPSSNGNRLEVTMDDINAAPKQHSFLHITTTLPDDKVSESKSLFDEIGSNLDDSNQHQTAQSKESSDTSFGPAIIEISDDESDTIDVMCRIPNKRRLLTTCENQRKSKKFKPNDTNGNEIEPEPKKSNGKQREPSNESQKCISTCLNGDTMKTINGNGSCDDTSSLSSDPQLVFPIEYS